MHGLSNAQREINEEETPYPIVDPLQANKSLENQGLPFKSEPRSIDVGFRLE